MATIIFLLILLVVVAIFSVQNAMPVIITFFFWKFEASLAIIVFLSLLSGIIAGAALISLTRKKPSDKQKITNELK
jgi:uncharacterized integral membrane protein